MASPARSRFRHFMIFLSFLVFVIAPAAGVVWYLKTQAADQYASRLGFAVRTEEVSSAFDLLGGLAGVSGASSSDTDILYEFIQSQALVAAIDKQLDLKSLYSKPENDPVFAFDPDGTIEDLREYWGRMIRVFYDSSTGLIELRVHAFSADDARIIAEAIFAESNKMINNLSAIARADATRYAEEELARAEERLLTARKGLTRFRIENELADPNAEITLQTGLLNALQQQLSDALIEQDLLIDTTRQNDPRISQAKRKIEVIEQRIAEERKKFSLSSGGENENFSDILEEFEGLQVDLEFAQQANLAARSAYDAAFVEAQRQSRYLAAYIAPTQPERAEYPKRIQLALLAFGALFAAWSVLILVYYSIKDRR